MVDSQGKLDSAGINHLIIQAGGKGTRMKGLTRNKPKCLISINGQPLLYNQINAFYNVEDVFIIADYKKDVLKRYVDAYNPTNKKITVVDTSGEGTIAGIADAAKRIKGSGGIAIVWSDLYFLKPLRITEHSSNLLFLSRENKCRWSYSNGELTEKNSRTAGVIGIFIFNDKSLLTKLPGSGEFVRYLKEKYQELDLATVYADNIKEIGTYLKFIRFVKNFKTARFFNNIEFRKKFIIKKVVDKAFQDVYQKEINWYMEIQKYKIRYIPKVLATNPLTLEKINGVHPWEIETEKARGTTLTNIIKSLNNLHSLDRVPFDRVALNAELIEKTKKRISRVFALIPENGTRYYVINNKKVKNLFYSNNLKDIDTLVNKISSLKYFNIIHGDPTFSNTLVETKSSNIKFIDPRGYFGKHLIFGDPRYDFAKLYYSAAGDYDQFNSGKFSTEIYSNSVYVKIKSNRYKKLAKKAFSKTDFNLEEIQIMHALIWLALSGYFMNDLDAVLGSYFHGLELFYEIYPSVIR